MTTVWIDNDTRGRAVRFFIMAARGGKKMAVIVNLHDLEDADIGERAWIFEGFCAVGGNFPFVTQIAEQFLELDPLIAF